MGYFISIVANLIWAGLLIHWFKRKTFYPIAGTDRRTKLLWGLAFLTFSPLMLLLYAVFCIWLKPAATPPRRLTASRILVFSSFAVSVLFVLPTAGPTKEPLTLTQDSRLKNPGLKTKAIATYSHPAQASFSGGFGFESITYLDMRRIAIMNYSKSSLADKIAKQFQQRLLESPMVEEVTYYPPGTFPTPGSRLPGMYIEICTKHVRSIPLPLSRAVQAEVSVRIHTQQTYTEPWQRLPISKQGSQLELKHSSISIGYESYGAHNEGAAERIMTEAFHLLENETFGGWRGSRPMPVLPDYALGHYTAPPDMPFKNLPILKKTTGYDLLTHNQTTWHFDDSRPTAETISTYRDTLSVKGWEEQPWYGDRLKMVRGSERLYIYRSDNSLIGDHSIPMVARYIHSFTPAEIETTLLKLLEDPTVSDDQLLFFGRQFRESESEKVAAAFENRMKTLKPTTLQAHLELARLLELHGEHDRALDIFAKTVAMHRILKDASARFRLDDAADELGAHEMLDSLPSDENFQYAGLHPLTELKGKTTFRVTAGERIGFYFLATDYSATTNENLRTFTYRIVQNPFKTATIHTLKQHPNRHWSLIYNGTPMADCFSSIHENGHMVDGSWTATITHQLPDPVGGQATAQVKQIGPDAFEVTINLSESETSAPELFLK